MRHENDHDIESLPGLTLAAGLLLLLTTDASLAGTPAIDGGAVPTILATHLLDDAPLPLPESARRESRALGFRVGGISDLVALHGPDGRTDLWGVTDRGPNGLVPKPGSDGDPADMLRTLPVPEFVPLLFRLELTPAEDGAGTGSMQVVESRPVVTASGRPTSGRPSLAPPRAKTMVDPATARVLDVDPDGIDSEGLAPAPGGGFWLAEEYAPSILRLDAGGTAVRRLVPAGTSLDGAGCEVLDSLPAECALRQDNRGFEALAVSPDGGRLFAMLQSPIEAAPDATADARIGVPILVLYAEDGATRGRISYRLGDPESPAAEVAAADGKISAITAIDDRRILVLEQSATESRIYEVDTGSAGGGHAVKTLVADLAPLAARFASDITPASQSAPRKLSDLKFEGIALLAPGVVALVNDNDFDMDAAGAAPASPPIRRTCLWVVELAGWRP